jgi:hypothetical protein
MFHVETHAGDACVDAGDGVCAACYGPVMLWTALLVACGGAATDTALDIPPPVGFLDALAGGYARGCEDTKIAVSPEEGNRSLSILLPGLVARAYATGGPHEEAWDFAAERIDGVAILEGTNVSAQYCTDIMVDGVEVTRTWTFVRGTMSATVTPTADGSDPYWTPADAAFRITDAAVTPTDDPGYGAVDVGGVTFDVRIGWYPG